MPGIETVKYLGLKLECEWDGESETGDGWHEPHEPGAFYLLNAYDTVGEDLLPGLSTAQTTELTQLVLEKAQEL